MMKVHKYRTHYTQSITSTIAHTNEDASQLWDTVVGCAEQACGPPNAQWGHTTHTHKNTRVKFKHYKKLTIQITLRLMQYLDCVPALFPFSHLRSVFAFTSPPSVSAFGPVPLYLSRTLSFTPLACFDESTGAKLRPNYSDCGHSIKLR